MINRTPVDEVVLDEQTSVVVPTGDVYKGVGDRAAVIRKDLDEGVAHLTRLQRTAEGWVTYRDALPYPSWVVMTYAKRWVV